MFVYLLRLNWLAVKKKKAEAAAASASTGAPPKPSGAKFKMTDVIDQFGLEDEHPADDVGMDAGYADYVKIFGDLPPENEDISVEQ